MAETKCHKVLLKLVKSQNAKVQAVADNRIASIGRLIQNYKGDVTSPAFQNLIKSQMKALGEEMTRMMMFQMTKAEAQAEDCLQAVVAAYTKGMPKDVQDFAFEQRKKALQGWMASRRKLIEKISTRVWQGDAVQQVRDAVEAGIFEGQSAQQIARDLKKYLREPKALYRRVRNDKGDLVPSKRMAAYHPGKGVYRSAYKNALRLARNEVNMAYRFSDHTRVQELEFVVGIRVQLSSAHPRFDICDNLVGTYPKEFIFLGWHPNCLCYTTTITMPRDQYIEYARTGEYNGTRITEIPKKAQKHLDEIAPKLNKAKSKPYFLSDNFTYRKGKYQLKSSRKP